MKRAKLALYGLAIAVMFCMVVYSLYFNRSATAGIAVAFLLALILIQQLPILESFEILTLKAKFRAQLDEATQLLDHLRESASVSARSTYLQLAYMNRMGDLGWDRKRAILSDIDQQLRRLAVPEVEISEYKRPFLNMLTFDLAQVLQHAVTIRLQKYRSEAEKIYQQRFKGGIRDHEGHSAFIAWKRGFADPQYMIADPLGRTDLDRPRMLFESWLDSAPLSLADRENLKVVLNEIVELSEACWQQGTVTAEAETYLDRYAPHSDGPDRSDEIQFETVQLLPPTP